MINHIISFSFILPFTSCISPGKLNESLELTNKMAKRQDKLRFELADSVLSFKQTERASKQRIIQLEDKGLRWMRMGHPIIKQLNYVKLSSVLHSKTSI